MASAEMIRMTMEDEVRQQLEKYHCVRGQLQYQAPSMVSLVGTRGDEKAVLIWQATTRLAYLLSQYVEQQTDCVGLTMDVDLIRNQFSYKWLSQATAVQKAAQQQQEREADEKQELAEKRRWYERRTDRYGKELAEKVAAALRRGSLGYGHRDYCGMGLEYRDGLYCYGSLWDGYMGDDVKQWSSKEAFVNWLAQQSDASMARLEEKDPFFWGNQTISRGRLEEFIN